MELPAVREQVTQVYLLPTERYAGLKEAGAVNFENLRSWLQKPSSKPNPPRKTIDSPA